MEFRKLIKKIIITGVLMIWFIKFIVRPYVPLEGIAEFTAGIAPNFLGSLLVPFVAYWLYTHPQFFNGRLLRFYFFSDTRIVCLTGFSLALVNEYLQLIPFFGRTFDYYDLVFSAFGLVLSFYCFSFLQKRLSAA